RAEDPRVVQAAPDPDGSPAPSHGWSRPDAATQGRRVHPWHRHHCADGVRDEGRRRKGVRGWLRRLHVEADRHRRAPARRRPIPRPRCQSPRRWRMTAPTILVVEDNPITRKMLRVVLQTEGYAVVEASDARAALAAAQAALPDLVLQDLILPDMDGLELVRRLRALAGGPELPILALSGFLSRLEESRTADAAFTALLVKPIEPGRLIDAIRAYLPEWRKTPKMIGKGQHLFVVDDDPVQLKFARIHFGHLGFAVTAAGGASDALRAAHAKRPDVVLSDVFMPEIDGFHLCLEFRRTPSLAQMPIVLVSSQ